MSITHSVVLTIGTGAVQVSAWDEYTVKLSMLHPGSPWTFTFWQSQQHASDWETLQRVKVGEWITLAIDSQVVLRGQIERRRPWGNRKDGLLLTLAGRDLAGPGMAADADPGLSLRNMALDDAMNRLFTGAGQIVEVSAHVDPQQSTSTLRVPRNTGARKVSRRQLLDLGHPHVGERIWSVAQRFAKRMGFLLWVAPITASRVGLVVDVPNYGGAPQWNLWRRVERGEVTLDSNILDGGEDLNVAEVPTSYSVFADAMRGDSQAARQQRSIVNEALFDETVTKGRVDASLLSHPRFHRSENARTVDAARNEAQQLIGEAMAGFRVCTYTVEGHGQFGVLYRPNVMASVRDDLVGIREDMLVLEVTLQGNRKSKAGQTTTLALGPKGAIRCEPSPEGT